MMKSPKPFILRVLQAAQTIETLIDGYTYQQFKKDPRTHFAVVKLIEIVGEACNSLTDDFRNSHPDIPWRAINGMRNRLVHEYWEIDHPTIWKTACKRIPELATQLEAILKSLSD